MEWHVEWHMKAIFRLSHESLGSTTDLKIDWIWHLLLKIEAGVIGPTFSPRVVTRYRSLSLSMS